MLLLLLIALASHSRLGATDIVREADVHVQKYRAGEVPLRAIDPSGRSVQAGRHVRVEQTRHKFLFGSNIFKPSSCRPPAHNAAYEKHFADLLNYASLPFYWWDTRA